MNPNAKFFYPTTALGADTTERTIFDSQAEAGFKNDAFLLFGFMRAILRMDWDTAEAQDLKWYYYPKGSTTAVQFSATETITITAPDDQVRDMLISGLAGLKVTLTNDNTAKTKHNISLEFSHDQAVAI